MNLSTARYTVVMSRFSEEHRLSQVSAKDTRDSKAEFISQQQSRYELLKFRGGFE